MAHTQQTYDVTGVVICDSCSADHSVGQPSAPGGILFESKAICPVCAPDWEAGAKTYGEEHFIRNRAQPGELFHDFVVRVRGGNNTMVVSGDDDFQNLVGDLDVVRKARELRREREE